MKKLLHFLVFIAFAWIELPAQCPEVLNCPVQPVSYCDLSPNNVFYWNNLPFYESFYGGHDLSETKVELSISAKDVCNPAGLRISYVLLLDLNGDGIQESAVSNKNPALLPGNILFGNATNPNYGGGTALQFDVNPVPLSQKYQFTLEQTLAGDVLTGRVRWSTNQAPGVYTDPELPVGTHKIRWLIKSGAVTNTCEHVFIIQKCSTKPEICIKSVCGGFGLEGASYGITGSGPGIPMFNFTTFSETGCPNFNAIPTSSNAIVTPFKDDNPLNGVSTYDLILINNHLSGTGIFNAPWKYIAADANNDGQITMADITEFQQLIQGAYSELPNNTSWRFYPENYVFPDPANPFQPPFPEQVVFSAIPAPQTSPFYFNGVKIGDVNCSVAGNVVSAEDRAAVSLTLPDLVLPAGQIVDIPVSVSVAGEWEGFQLALQLDEDQIVLEEVIPGDLPGMDKDVFAQTRSGLSASWFLAEPQWLAPGERLFTLRVRTLAPVQLREALRLAAKGLLPEAYPSGDGIRRLELTFRQPADAGIGSAIFPAQPNPTSGGAIIPLRLREATSVTLELVDFSGKRLYTAEQIQPPGTSILEIPASAFPQAGLYYWQVRAGSERRGDRLIRL